jgi:uncharacterized membrane protein
MLCFEVATTSIAVPTLNVLVERPSVEYADTGIVITTP